MPELIVAPAARADLLAQWEFYADDVGNPNLADRFVASARTTFEKLARTPGLGHRRQFRSPKAKNLRSWKVGDFPKHVIFYRPCPTGVAWQSSASSTALPTWKHCSGSEHTRTRGSGRIRPRGVK